MMRMRSLMLIMLRKGVDVRWRGRLKRKDRGWLSWMG